MEKKTKKENKPMFLVGLAMILIAATLFLTAKEDLGMSPTILGIIGIVTMGASKYRPLK